MTSSAAVAVGCVFLTATLAALGFLIRKWIGNIETGVGHMIGLVDSITDRLVGLAERVALVEAWQRYHHHDRH